jgi:hypothetical protein
MFSRLPIVALLFCLAACADTGPSQPEVWTSETLQPGMLISFPRGFEGDGYRCGIDACYFDKSRSDGAITFSFPVSGMTGYTPAQFATLPVEYLYPHRDLVETQSGLSAAFYYVLENEHEFPQSFGVFVVETRDGSGFREVVWVRFDAAQFARTNDVLRTVDYEQL